MSSYLLIIIPTFILLSEINGKHIEIEISIWTTNRKATFLNEHNTNVNRNNKVSSRSFGTIRQTHQSSAAGSQISSEESSESTSDEDSSEENISGLDVKGPGVSCCREKGVPDVCFGYCEKESTSKQRRVIQTGICQNWFELIGICRGEKQCNSNPCQNSGVCTEDGPDNYKCSCTAGFTGNNCEIAPIDCAWSDWEFGQCSKTCGGGTRTNYRKELVQQPNGGKACAGSTWEAQVCNSQACAVEANTTETSTTSTSTTSTSTSTATTSTSTTTISTTTSLPPQLAQCPMIPFPLNETVSWDEIPTIDDYCFLFNFKSGQEMDYFDAVDFCENVVTGGNKTIGSRVVEPRTAALQQAIEAHGRKYGWYGGKSMWGGYNDFSEGNWKWASGDSVVYEHWSGKDSWSGKQQPENTYDSDCMNIADYYGYYWDDVQCDSTSKGYPIFAACMAPKTS